MQMDIDGVMEELDDISNDMEDLAFLVQKRMKKLAKRIFAANRALLSLAEGGNDD
jgi:hypothetical protein